MVGQDMYAGQSVEDLQVGPDDAALLLWAYIPISLSVSVHMRGGNSPISPISPIHKPLYCSEIPISRPIVATQPRPR
jgi:hypothetical protein